MNSEMKFEKNGLLIPNGALEKQGLAGITLSAWLGQDHILLMPQEMTALQLLAFFGDFYDDFDRDAAVQMMQRLGIQPKQQIKQMSKGTREKVQLILVMSRKAKLYLLDEPIGGVDPATRDFILNTIISNYNPEAAVVVSTHLIADVENILDDVAFLSRGHLLLQSSADELRAKEGKSVDAVFREVFRC